MDLLLQKGHTSSNDSSLIWKPDGKDPKTDHWIMPIPRIICISVDHPL